MKNLIIISFLFVQIFYNAEQKNNDLEVITSGKWFIEYMEINETKQSLPENLQKINWMIFHKDGKHEVMTMNEKHIGKWEYSGKTKTFKMSEKENVINQKIEKLNEMEMILSFRQGEKLIKIGLKK